MSYKESDDDEEVQMVSVHNENNSNNYNVVSTLESDEVEENLFEEQVEDEIKATPKTTVNPKVRVTKILHALYDEDMSKIVEHAAQENTVNKTLNFLII